MLQLIVDLINQATGKSISLSEALEWTLQEYIDVHFQASRLPGHPSSATIPRCHACQLLAILAFPLYQDSVCWFSAASGCCFLHGTASPNHIVARCG